MAIIFETYNKTKNQLVSVQPGQQMSITVDVNDQIQLIAANLVTGTKYQVQQSQSPGGPWARVEDVYANQSGTPSPTWQGSLTTIPAYQSPLYLRIVGP